MDLSKIMAENLFTFLAYAGSLIVVVFSAGWFLNTKIKTIIDDSNKTMVDTMTALTKRVEKLEDDSVRIVQHDKDMASLYNLINGVKDDVRVGFDAMSKRIDTLLLVTKTGT